MSPDPIAPAQRVRALVDAAQMLVAPGGRGRTLDEWRRVFEAGGFKLDRAEAFGDDWHVIVAWVA